MQGVPCCGFSTTEVVSLCHVAESGTRQLSEAIVLSRVDGFLDQRTCWGANDELSHWWELRSGIESLLFQGTQGQNYVLGMVQVAKERHCTQKWKREDKSKQKKMYSPPRMRGREILEWINQRSTLKYRYLCEHNVNIGIDGNGGKIWMK